MKNLSIFLWLLGAAQVALGVFLIGNALTARGSANYMQIGSGIGLLNAGAIIAALAAIVWCVVSRHNSARA